MAPKERRSQIFIVRVWTEEREESSHELRGLVRNLHSGEARYFHCWKELVAFAGSEMEVQESRDCQS